MDPRLSTVLLLAVCGCREAAAVSPPGDAAASGAIPTGRRAPASPAPEPTTGFDLDLDGDTRPERIAAYLAGDRTRGFVTVGAPAAGPGDSWTSPIYPAWKTAGGRLDDDRRGEVVLGIWSRKPGRPGPQPHRTVWVLGWDGRRLVERWRGSALARPLVDFAVIDADGDGTDELLALETLEDACWIVAYRWNGSGFEGRARKGVPCAGLRFCDDVTGGACVEAGGRRSQVALRDRAIAVEEERR